MKNYVQDLEAQLKAHRNSGIATQQKAYMRNQFEYVGIKTPIRRELQKSFLKKPMLPPKKELDAIIRILWEKPERDFQLFGQDLVYKYRKQFELADIDLLEFMIISKSWWDTVDFIAAKLVGSYLKDYYHQRDELIQRWLKSKNIWLQRSCLLFQLKYKHELDQDYLSSIILELLGSKEFFINKAIGWVLREHSKINPDWVWKFANDHPLSSLSYKEATRLILNSN